MGAQQSAFPFRLTEQLRDATHSLFSVHAGVSNATGDAVTIFQYDKGKASNEDRLLACRNAVKRFKTLRHPGLLKYIADVELDATIFLVVEECTPWRGLSPQQSPELLCWGVYQLSAALAFLHCDCKLIHANLQPSSLFIDKVGSWKLGGFELLHEVSPEGPPAYTRRNIDIVSEVWKMPGRIFD
jgi:SCY1-like protein 1